MTRGPWCVQDPRGLLSVRLGLESIRSFPPELNDVRLGMMATGVALLLLAYRTLTYLRYKRQTDGVKEIAPLPQLAALGPISDDDDEKGRDQCAMRLIIAGYTVGTALFAWSRAIWDTSKMLLILAATHNMMEWMLIGSLYFVDEYTWRKTDHLKNGKLPWWTAQKTILTSFLWIWLVITITVSLPTIEAVLFEQSLGIACDYILVITFAMRYFKKGAHSDLRALWGYGLIASSFHFGQIYPLVLGTFLPNTKSTFGGRLIEWTLIFTAAITFYAYSQFAIRWENLHYDHNAELDREQSDTKRTPAPGPSESRVKSFFIIVIIGYLLGFATIFGPAKTFGLCDKGGHHAAADGTITGYTRVYAKPGQGKALRQALSAMPPMVIKEHGAVAYDLYNINDLNQPDYLDKLLVIEKWKDMSALQAHLKSSVAVNGIWRSDYVKDMMLLDKQEISGPWGTVDTDPVDLVESNLAFNFNLAKNRKACWDVISNWKDCSWVEGCKNAILLPGGRRKMDMGGASLDVARRSSEPYTLVYEILSGASMFAHYTGTITLTEGPNGSTDASYSASFYPAQGVKIAEATAFVSQDFINNRIPFLKSKFGNGNGNGKKQT